MLTAIKKEIEDGQHKASEGGGGSPEAPAAAANAEIPFTESQLVRTLTQTPLSLCCSSAVSHGGYSLLHIYLLALLYWHSVAC